MNHRAGLDRSQTLLFPERLADYIAAENPARFLDTFVAMTACMRKLVILMNRLLKNNDFQLAS